MREDRMPCCLNGRQSSLFETSGTSHSQRTLGLEKGHGQSSHRFRRPMPAYRHKTADSRATAARDCGFLEHDPQPASRFGSDISFLGFGPVMILGIDPSSSTNREGHIMRWKEGRRSENVEDRRGITPAGIAIGGGIGTLLLALAAIFLGADPRQVLNALQQQQQQQAPAGRREVAEKPRRGRARRLRQGRAGLYRGRVDGHLPTRVGRSTRSPRW